MKAVTDKEIRRKIELENPWWEQEGIDSYFSKMKHRAYLDSFYKLVKEREVRRAVVLMGPRRVGKTVMIYHAIQQLLDEGVEPKRICYISIDAPVYIGIGLEQLLLLYKEASGLDSLEGCYIYFDEIQYLKDWEVHLKKLVDDYRDVKFIASGSAAAALKMKSQESGAGRFTNYMLPPLSFYEFLHLREIDGASLDYDALNKEFIDYINFGGFPEAVFSEAIRGDMSRYIRSDIIDKVLLRDLPSLYGIHDVQELNRLFSMLAYNTGNEVSLDELSQGSGVAKNTIKKYLGYLEAAFLITVLHRVDQSGKRFKRANFFKVYLTNPSMRSALFEPVTNDSPEIGHLVETAFVTQFAHSLLYMKSLYYSRWNKGEVDLVILENEKITVCMEIKWSNKYFKNPGKLKSLLSLSQKNKDALVAATTLNKSGVSDFNDIKITFVPTSAHSYTIGKSIMDDISVHKMLINKIN
ncbi:MAG: ATP-binding protein [Thermodesulfovibrionales bacterium]|nr:ATP-binding protein [Thermodesulfovibrionales bacterium]